MKSLSPVRLVVTPQTEPISGSCIHRNFQARVLEWVAISFSRVSSRPRELRNPKRSCCDLSKSVLSLFSSRNFITSGLTLRSLIWVYLCIWCQIHPLLYLYYVALGLVSLLHDFDQHRDVLLYKDCKQDFSEKDRKKKKAVFYFESPRTEKIVIYL